MDGVSLFSVSADRTLQQRDLVKNEPSWKQRKAHPAAINCVTTLAEAGVATGDDNGGLTLWDLRQRAAALSFSEHSDFISDILFVPEKGQQLAVSSGDGHLSLYDLRRGRLNALSDNQEEELSCLALVKQGRKLLCGTQSGVLGIFSWGDFGDVSDRLVGHPDAIDAMVAYDDDVVFTGSSDGLIRAVSVHPNAVLGLVGEHANGVEALALGAERSRLASCSHEGIVQLWDVGELRGMAGAEQEDDSVAAKAKEASGRELDSEDDAPCSRHEPQLPAHKKLKATSKGNAAIKMSTDFFADM
mmetsp:Transcript_38005/g.62851  ORF Transcript_38005/g.62851 Transcript_38005/m.62851 type:complete len:301 (+) Transcript_38005:3-905(+)